MKVTPRAAGWALVVLAWPPLLLWAGPIDDALNLPGMEEIKEAVGKGEVTVSFADLDNDVLAEQDGKDLRLNSDAFDESTDPGVIAQEIVHEYWHFKLKHDCDCKENEVPVRKKEAEFWRAYKAAHPGVTNEACDANEEAVYTNGAFRSDAAIQKRCRARGYPDEKDAKQRSHCRHDVSCPTSGTCTITQIDCETALDLNGSRSIIPDSVTATIGVQPPDAYNVSRFTVTAYQASAPAVSIPGFGLSGVNAVGLDPSVESFGYIDRTTNRVTLYLHSRITNGLFPPSNPIRVRTHGQGLFEPGPGGGGELTLDTLAIDDVPLLSGPTGGAAAASQIPTLTGWGLLLLMILMLAMGMRTARRAGRRGRPA